MALRYNTLMRNALTLPITDNFGVGTTVEIRTGTQPASAQDAASGTLLCTITLPATPWSAPSTGVINKAGTWSGTAGATGTAGYARFLGTAGRNFDVSVGEAATDMIIDNAAIVTGGTVTVNTLSYTVPAG